MNYPPHFSPGRHPAGLHLSLPASFACLAVRFLLALLLGLTLSVRPALGADADAESPADAAGVIEGRVSNIATGQYLENALVLVRDTKIWATTDALGAYRLSGLAPGDYTLEVSYSGLDPVSQTFSVTPGAKLKADFELKAEEIYTLEKVVVKGEREGQSQAIQDQRNADGSKYAMAVENFGNVQNGNIGEVMKQLPGIMVFEDMGQPVSMSVRGLDPSALPTAVTVNGNSMASAGSGGTDRGFALSGFNANDISSVEIWKAATPAQAGNSTGGAVNFTTKSAFQQKGRRLRFNLFSNFTDETFGLGASAGSGGESNRKIYPGINAYYSEAFGVENPLGIVFTLGGDRNGRRTTRYQSNQLRVVSLAKGQDASAADPVIPNGSVWQQFEQVMSNRALSLTVDYKLSEQTTLYVITNYNTSDNVDGGEQKVSMNVSAPAAATTRDRLVVEPAQQNRLNVDSNLIRQNRTNWSVNPGVKQRLGDLMLNYDAYFSRSKTTNRNLYVSYQLNTNSKDAANRIGFVVDNVNDTSGGTLTQTSGPDMGRLDNYGMLGIKAGGTQGTDERLGTKIDARRHYAFRFPLKLQSGLAVNIQKTRNTNAEKWYLMTGPDSILGSADDPSVGQFANPNRKNEFYFSSKFPALATWVDPQAVWSYFLENPGMFRPDFSGGGNVPREIQGRKQFREKISAAYFMGTLLFGKFTLLAGARVEQTDLSGTGAINDALVGNTNTPDYNPDREAAEIAKRRFITNRRKYDNWFPNVHLKYEASKKFLLRASVNHTIGRPNLGNLIPNDSVDPTALGNTGRIIRTNPNLSPQLTTNYDASVEYYPLKHGSVTASVFRKDIKKYIFTTTTIIEPGIDNGFGGDYAGYSLEESRNVGHAVHEGIELGYHQQLRFLPGLFGNLRVDANWAANRGTIDRAGDGRWSDELVDSVPRLANLGIGYTGKTWGWQFKANYRARYLSKLSLEGAAVTDARYFAARTQCDLGLTCKVSRLWTFYADCKNLLRSGYELQYRSGLLSWYDDNRRGITVGMRAEF